MLNNVEEAYKGKQRLWRAGFAGLTALCLAFFAACPTAPSMSPDGPDLATPDSPAPDLASQDQPDGPPAQPADLATPALDLSWPSETLYVGDLSDNTVKEFHASTGQYLRTLFPSGSGGLKGPMGLLVEPTGNELWVVNQNLGLPKNGAILRFQRSTGTYLGALVADTATGSPYAPRGMVLSPAGQLIVADNGELTPPPPGRLPHYSGSTGAFVADFDKTGFTPPFLPRGVVVGPDGLLYVSVIDGIGQNGYVVRFDLTTKKYKDTFVTATAATSYAGGMHKPEGIVFGPDGRLYVTSARYQAGDTSRIMIYDNTGAYVDRIDLDNALVAQNYAQAMVFGPGGRLFVGMSIAGEIRSYDVQTKTYVSFVATGGPLKQPWYLVFNRTNPTTLAYQP